MINQKPEFLISEHSVFSVVTELHNYFQDLQSYYTIARGQIVDQLETANKEQEKDLHAQLKQTDDKIALFLVLNNSISTIDTVIHTQSMIEELKQS